MSLPRLQRPTCAGCGEPCISLRSTRCVGCYRERQREIARAASSAALDSPMCRRTVRTMKLRGTSGYDVKKIRERIKRGSGEKRYVYKSHDKAREIVIANHEVPGRTDLIGVYDCKITAEMVRVDILNEDPDSIRARG